MDLQPDRRAPAPTSERLTPIAPGEGPPGDGVRSAYLDALHDGSGRTSQGVLRDALEAGTTARELILDVVTPALRDVGSGWARNEITVAHEHLATSIVLDDLRFLRSALADTPVGSTASNADGGTHGRVALVASTEDELHTVGARILADFLDAAGWEVLYVGAATPGDGLARLVDERRPDVVALSTTLPEHLAQAGVAVRRLRALAEPPVILVGGAAYADIEDAAASSGADLYGRDPVEAVAILRERFAAVHQAS